MTRQECKSKSYELWKESYEVEHERNRRLEERIKALEQEPCIDDMSSFVKWVATEVFDEWEYNKDSFAEIACRKLAKLGIVRAKGNEWELVEPQERSN